MLTINEPLMIGIDVGSTTVKAVVCNTSGEILWRDYQRHETRQRDMVFELLETITDDLGTEYFYHLFITGIGGGSLTALLNARFVQEVNAVSLAVERLHPNAGSVIELGGQDAKIIVFKNSADKSRKRKIFSMNDKCAGGTGTVIDKIAAKLNIEESALAGYGYEGVDIHPIAAKCGVFAETDINGLQKNGVPAEQLLASLYDAIVMQNLTILTRGNTLFPEVILLGGPNTFLPGLVQAWRFHIAKIWQERSITIPPDRHVDELIHVPVDSHYYAALGAVFFGFQKPDNQLIAVNLGELLKTRTLSIVPEKTRSSGHGLHKTLQELNDFKKKYERPATGKKITTTNGKAVTAYIGVDCGSTSTKAVLIDEQGELIARSYQLSSVNPIDDTRYVLNELQHAVTDKGMDLKILGCATTGYAKDVLKGVIGADTALVETVAHTQAALHFYNNVDVICDVGGQDIKIIILRDGRIKDFRLNTQCSAGNGYFLQNTSETLGISVEDYADVAFSAQNYPEFGYGCSVFMHSDIVDFQRQGWRKEEILAGLAAVLPKNIWLFVAAMPNLSALGNRFLLQGGTQKNLAAVKAQVDFIHSRFAGSGVEPDVKVHQYCGESGAIGAALEARRIATQGKQTNFIGFEALKTIAYRIHNNEHTVCYFCENKCQRTFIDVQMISKVKKHNNVLGSKIPLQKGGVRIICGNNCDKGLVEDIVSMRAIKKEVDEVNHSNPNFVTMASEQVWKKSVCASVKMPTYIGLFPEKNRLARKNRANCRIGIPRVLNFYSTNPLFSAYFESLGIKPRNIIYSSFSSEEMYRQGSRRSSIDPCFPSKVAIAHVHQLVFGRGKKKPVNWIFFPMINTLDSALENIQDSCACPTVTATPEVVKAAMTKEEDLFKSSGIRYLNPMLDVSNQALFESQLFTAFAGLLGLSRFENRQAVANGYRALEKYKNDLRAKGRELIDSLVRENRIGIVLLARSYHNDPGINHGIPEQFQALGYPVLTLDTLPLHADTLSELFEQDVVSGSIDNAMCIDDVWKNSYSENTNQKVWAAKYVARHPNLVALELSSFKCGHDAPIYTVVEQIIESSGTPYFCFKDIDENKPSASIKIRLETIDYFLQRYRESQLDIWQKQKQLKNKLEQYENYLRSSNKTDETLSVILS